jgi:hypothetical protein
MGGGVGGGAGADVWGAGCLAAVISPRRHGGTEVFQLHRRDAEGAESRREIWYSELQAPQASDSR